MLGLHTNLADPGLHLIEPWQEVAPSRVPRDHLSSLRSFFREAHETLGARQNDVQSIVDRKTGAIREVPISVIALRSVPLFYTNERQVVAAAKLGVPVPMGAVYGEWRMEKVWGLNVQIAAHDELGRSYLILRHRFRSSCKVAEFMRIMGMGCRVAIGAARTFADVAELQARRA